MSETVAQTQFNRARFDLLGHASFSTGASALADFHAWDAQIDWLAHLNPAEFRLLPQLYRNLHAQGIEHARLGKFKGIARKAWYYNKLYFHHLAPTVRAMRVAGLECLVLYGGASALRYDDEYLLEYGGDCGILVRTAQARSAFQQLERLGWAPTPRISERGLDAYLRARYFHPFQNEQRDRITLQWELFPHCAENDTGAPFWERADEWTMNDVPVRVLSPTDQLVHTCVFGPAARGAPAWQRATEAQLLLCRASGEIDWDSLPGRVSSAQVVVPVREVFAALDPAVSARIPRAVGVRIASLPVSVQEQRAPYWYSAGTPRARVIQLWHLAARRTRGSDRLRRAIAFPQFLKDWWALENVTSIVPRGLSALRRHGGHDGE